MKTLMVALFALLASNAFAQSTRHEHHVKHNMVLVGENEIFASHIVYKAPHNYQVILGLDLSDEAKRVYLNVKKANPNALFILLLDPIDLDELSTKNWIAGTMLFRDDRDQSHVIIPKITLTRENFRVLYFDKLPLSLESDRTMESSSSGITASSLIDDLNMSSGTDYDRTCKVQCRPMSMGQERCCEICFGVKKACWTRNL